MSLQPSGTLSSAALQPARGGLLTSTREGQTIFAPPPREWEHPWTTRPAFANGRWSATVKAGFVNGDCPVVRTSAKEQAQLGGFGRDLTRVIDARSGRSEIRRAASLSSRAKNGTKATDEKIDVPLYRNPSLPLSFHAVETIPKFFQRRGAANPTPAFFTSAGDFVEAVPAPDGSRRLLACDVWIHQPRLALTSSIELHPGPATGISNVSQTLSLRGATPGDALRVMSGKLLAIAGIDPLARVYEEPNYDERLIATVFALSRPDADSQSEPDGAWEIFVQHDLFWNVNYVTPWFRQYGGDPSIPFLPPLAGGAAQLVTNFLLASLNDLTQEALNLVTAHSMAGTFYTPTGGGHSAEMPAQDAEARGASGLDRSGRAAAKARALSQARIGARLDPPFPYRAEPCPVALLSQTN